MAVGKNTGKLRMGTPNKTTAKYEGHAMVTGFLALHQKAA